MLSAVIRFQFRCGDGRFCSSIGCRRGDEGSLKSDDDWAAASSTRVLLRASTLAEAWLILLVSANHLVLILMPHIFVDAQFQRASSHARFAVAVSLPLKWHQHTIVGHHRFCRL